MRIIKLLSAALPLIGLLGACSDGGSPPATDESTTTTVTPRTDDGVLLVGAILPRTGVAAELGVSMGAALSLAIDEINDAGGIAGNTVRLIEREEGDNEATASLAVIELLQLGVDAIIGPTSSTNTLATLGPAVDAGVLTCGPTASAIALDTFPDEGLFIRTIPSDSLQADALAAVVESTGTTSAVIVYVDDNYGRPFAEEARRAVLAEGTAVAAMVPFSGSEESAATAVSAVVAAAVEVVVVIADGNTGPAIITAIDDASNNAPTFVVNDAIRRPATSALPFARSLNARIQGVSPVAYPSSASFLASLRSIEPTATGLFAHNAYDCLTAIALAAHSAGSDNPAMMAREIPVVTDQGTQCNNFTACVEALATGRLIDYSGPGRDLTIGNDGEMLTAVFERFMFDVDGRDVGSGFVTVGD